MEGGEGLEGLSKEEKVLMDSDDRVLIPERSGYKETKR